MIWSDTRAVSITLNYSIAIGITTLLTAGLIIGAAGLIQSQQERVARQQADEIGAERSETTVQLEYPSTLAGSSYTVSFNRSSDRFDQFEWTLRINSSVLTGGAVYPVPKSLDVEVSSTVGASPVLCQRQNGNITFGGC